jgi:hypothetical protein
MRVALPHLFLVYTIIQSYIHDAKCREIAWYKMELLLEFRSANGLGPKPDPQIRSYAELTPGHQQGRVEEGSGKISCSPNQLHTEQVL